MAGLALRVEFQDINLGLVGCPHYFGWPCFWGDFDCVVGGMFDVELVSLWLKKGGETSVGSAL